MVHALHDVITPGHRIHVPPGWVWGIEARVVVVVFSTSKVCLFSLNLNKAF